MSAATHFVAVRTHPHLTLLPTLVDERKIPYDPDVDELAMLSEQVAHDPDATPPARYFELLAKSKERMI